MTAIFATTTGSTSRRKRRMRSALVVAAFVGPALVVYCILMIWPLLQVGFDSFFAWTGSVRRDFTGLQNYQSLFSSGQVLDQILNAFRNNAVFFVGTMLVQNTIGLVLAVLLHRLARVKIFFQTIISLPYLMNPLVIGYIWTLLLNPASGPVASLLKAVGLGDWVHPWLSDPTLALPLTVLINAWQWAGFPMLLFSAAIAGIPEELYAAASVDGATRRQQFFQITLPLLTPVITVLTVLTFIASFNAFSLQLAIGGLNGGPNGVVDTLGLVFYRSAFGGELNSFGTSSALAVLTFILIFGGATVLRKALTRIEERIFS